MSTHSTKDQKEDTASVEASESPPAPQPAAADGGRKAWMTVLGCSLAFFVTQGFVTGFGIYQSYYESIFPNRSSDDISWIGSFQLWCITGMAIPSVLLNAHLGPHWTLAIGTFMVVFGVMMASIAKEYYQILLSHGICVGIGIGLTFLPIVGLPNQWFTKRRALAVGLAISGSSLGGVIWPIIVNQMLLKDNVGFPWTMRAIGFLQLFFMVIAIALIRNKIPRNRALKFGSFPFKSALKQVGVDLMIVAILLHFMGIYIPYFYAPLYAESLDASTSTAFYVSSALNAATLFGRMIVGALADFTGPTNALMVCVFISAMLAFAWQGVNSIAGIFVWSVFYGFFSGASISLQSPALIPLIPEGKLQLIGPYIAIICQLASFGSLVGNPIAGALLKMARPAEGQFMEADFHPMMWFTRSILLGALLFYYGQRHTHTPTLLAKV